MTIDYYDASKHETTAEFMRELIELMEKHSLAVVPTYSGYMSFHDSLMVVPATQKVIDFFAHTYVVADGAKVVFLDEAP